MFLDCHKKARNIFFSLLPIASLCTGWAISHNDEGATKFIWNAVKRVSGWCVISPVFSRINKSK